MASISARTLKVGATLRVSVLFRLTLTCGLCMEVSISPLRTQKTQRATSICSLHRKDS